MATLDATAFDRGLKILYPKGLTYQWLKDASNTVKWLPKANDFVGKQWNINPVVGAVRGSHTFADALNDKSTPTFVEFHVTRVPDYALVSVSAEMIAASKTDVGALRQAIQVQTDAAMAEMARARSMDVWGNGGGAIGLSVTIAGTLITLATVSDVIKVDVGMRLELASDDGTGGAGVRVGAPGYVTVSAIASDTGVITCTGNVAAAIAGAVSGDYVFRKGDYAAAIAGLYAWNPATAPGATLFFGVDRTTHLDKLSGSRINGGGANKEDVIIEACQTIARYGGRPDTLLVNPMDLGDLMKGMQSKVYVPVKTSDPSIGLTALQIMTPRGSVNVIDDEFCPQGHAKLTRRDTWLLRTLGADPHFAQEDGLKWRTEGSADAVEARLRSWGNLGCLDLRHTMDITW